MADFYRNNSLRLAFCFCLLFIFTMIGCKKGIERAMVSGSVTLDGKPLPQGEVRFVPIGVTKGPSWTAWIKNGKYSTEGSKGTPIGELKVEIIAYRPIGRATTAADNEGGLPQEQYIPPKFNIESDIKMTIAPGAGKVEQNFDLKTK